MQIDISLTEHGRHMLERAEARSRQDGKAFGEALREVALEDIARGEERPAWMLYQEIRETGS